jgi:CHASE2 domain-containing sensor protein/nitrogen-specific signal transduction histidine kinase
MAGQQGGQQIRHDSFRPASFLIERFRHHWAAVAIAPIAAMVASLVSSSGMLQRLDWAALDTAFRLRPREPVDARITLVTIDEQDIGQVGQWPIPDEILAKTLRRLNAQAPRVIGLNLYRDLPVEPGHAQLRQIFRASPNLIGVYAEFGAHPVPPPMDLAAQGRVAFADVLEDSDGIVRRGLLAVREEQPVSLSLATAIALRYLSLQGIQLQSIASADGRYQLGRAEFVAFQANDGGYVRADDRGYQTLVNFRGGLDRFDRIPLRDILNPQVPIHRLRDRIVLIGTIAESVETPLLTPYTSTESRTDLKTYPIVVHANIISHLISAALEERAQIRTLPDWVEWLWSLLWASITVGILGWLLRSDRLTWQQRCGSVALAVVLLEAALGGVSYGLFLASWWMPVAAPLLAVGLSATLAVGLALHRLQTMARQLHATTQTQSAELQRLDRLKDEFLSTISHELRTPIANIRMATQMLEVNLARMSDSARKSPTVERYVQILKEACQREASLINDLLDLADVNSNTLELHPTPIDVATELRQIVESFGDRAARHQQTIYLHLPNTPTEALPTLITDVTYFKRMVTELLTNACKFTPNGEHILVQAFVSKSPQNLTTLPKQLIIAVRNTGVEISAEELPRVFDKFYRIPHHDPWQLGGAGIGLALVQKLADRLGANIQVSSGDLQTQFILTFPLA